MLKSHSKLNNLFESLITLKRHTKSKLFLLSMRKKRIDLIFEKQFIVVEERKKAESDLTSNENLVFFDFKVSFVISFRSSLAL